MEYNLTVPAAYIAVLKLFVGKQDIRQYLNGIALEIGASESRAVATDGHRLGMFRIKSEQPYVSPTDPLINILIPLELLQGIKAKGEVEISLGECEVLEPLPGQQRDLSVRRPVTLTYAGVSVSGMTTDARYVDFRRSIPQKTSGEAAQFNPLYVGDLHKAAHLLGYKLGGGIAHNGTLPALIHLDENFIGVIMPWRRDAPSDAPDWAADGLNQRAQPEAEAA